MGGNVMATGIDSMENYWAGPLVRAAGPKFDFLETVKG